MPHYLVSISDPRIRFEILDFDPETKIGKLKGPTGEVFTRDISKKSCTKYGYTMREIKDGKGVPRKQEDGED